MAAGFIALAPLLERTLPAALLLLFLHTPGYMIHQVEEHRGDRFRTFVNGRLFGGLNVLTVGDVLVVNLPLVWGLNLGALYAGYYWGAGYGLVAPYAMLVNAVIHFVTGARLRAYNPGLLTSAFVFLPLSVAAIWTIGALPTVDLAQHLLGLGFAVLLHLLIVVHSAGRLRRLGK